MKPKLRVLEGTFTIHRFPPNHEIPHQVIESEFYSISKTDDELSIVCPSSSSLNSEKSETGWSGIAVVGPLDFSLIGILSVISTVLAGAGVSIFVVSTFDADYILVKTKKLPLAVEALQAAGYTTLT